jgi:hypothetical protein
VSSPAQRGGTLDTFLRLLAGLALLLGVLLMAALLIFVVTLAGSISQLGGNLGGLGAALERTNESVQRVSEGVLGVVDPTHPPQTRLFQDTEFLELHRVAVGQSLGTSGEYELTLAGIQRRADATNADEAQYAIVHRKLKTPRQRSLGPLSIGEDWDEADHYLYKGESFRAGSQYLKVNWVSLDQGVMALALYRDGDNLTVPLKFQID